MGMLEDIRPLTPVPSSASIGHQRPHRIQHEEKPAQRPRTRRQPQDDQEKSDTDTNHIDEYA
ncbi:MAG: hypothetical protein WBN81_02405 [Gammaproteobacteria bacterium]